MTLTHFLFVIQLQTAIFIIGGLLAMYRHKTRDSYIRVLGYYLLFSASCEYLGMIFHHFKIPTNFAGSLFALFDLPFISAIYWLALGKKNTTVFLTIALGYMIFVALMFYIDPYSIPSQDYTVTAIFAIGYSLYYFYWLLKELPTTQIQTLPMFWINSAVIIYHASNFFVFVFTSYLVHVLNDNMMIYWTIHNSFGVLEGIMILVGVLMDLRSNKMPSVTS